MGSAESVRASFGPDVGKPEDIAFGVALGHERFGPGELMEQAMAAEEAGFDAVCCRDHLAP